MTRNKALLAMGLTALLAGGFGWRWERRFGGNFDRRLMADGRRSVAVSAANDELRGVGPGDRVDVLVVFDATTNNVPQKYSATILQNALVLGTRRPWKSGGNGVIYLSLNPMEAQFASLSARQGEVSIILRKPGDVEIHPVEMSTFKSLFR